MSFIVIINFSEQNEIKICTRNPQKKKKTYGKLELCLDKTTVKYQRK